MKKISLVLVVSAVAVGVFIGPTRLARADDVDDLGSPQQDIANATAKINAGGDRDALIAAYSDRADAERGLQLYGEAIADYSKVIELDKQAPARDIGVAAYYRGLAELDFDVDKSSYFDFTKSDKSDAAITDFSSALAAQNDWSDAHLARARARFLQGDLKDAREDTAAAKADLKSATDKAAWKEPDFPEDLALANKALHENHNDGAAWRARGLLRFRSAVADRENGAQAMERAAHDFDSAAQLDQKSPAPLLDATLAQVVLHAGQNSIFDVSHRDEILTDFDDTMKRDANYTPALAAKAIYLLSTPPKVVSIIPNDADRAAAAKETLQARADAIALINQAAAIEPQVAQWPALLALVERSNPAPDAKKLVEIYTRAVTLAPRDLPPELTYTWPAVFSGATGDAFKAEMLDNRAQVYASTNDADNAIADVNAALKLHPQVARHLLRARLYSQKKNWDGVIADVNFSLGDAMDGDDLPDLSEVMSVSDAQHADALLLRATAYDQKGDFANAQKDVDEALKIDPKRADLLKGTRYDKTGPK